MSDNNEDRKYGIPHVKDYPEPPAPHEVKAPEKTVSALIDTLVFCEFFKEIQEKEIKIWRNVKCIEKCFVEVVDKDIYCSGEKGGWIVSIVYKLIIEYITDYGFEHKVIKTDVFTKCIPFPLTDKHDDHGMIDFTKATPCLFVEKVDCIDIKFKNIDCNAFIKVVVELDFKVLATIKKDYNILVDGPVC
jgi:hypothetical protein